jgi:hypothetical protein
VAGDDRVEVRIDFAHDRAEIRRGAEILLAT